MLWAGHSQCHQCMLARNLIDSTEGAELSNLQELHTYMLPLLQQLLCVNKISVMSPSGQVPSSRRLHLILSMVADEEMAPSLLVPCCCRVIGVRCEEMHYSCMTGKSESSFGVA